MDIGEAKRSQWHVALALSDVAEFHQDQNVAKEGVDIHQLTLTDIELALCLHCNYDTIRFPLYGLILWSIYLISHTSIESILHLWSLWYGRWTNEVIVAHVAGGA